jgi:predicted metal-dependent hydrolase
VFVDRLRGVSRPIEAIPEGQGAVRIDGEVIEAGDGVGDLRPLVERHLRELAQRELASRAWELAARHSCALGKVCIRNQRTRWGSCSRRGTVSLNWRLIQVPETVRDYLILHELMHLREMNHSRRFWQEVERVCPGYREAERWLRRNAALLG